MPRKKTDAEVIQEAAKAAGADAKQKKIDRLQKRMNRVLNGNKYHGKEIHEAYERPQLLQRQIVTYFNLCDLEHKPMTLPGLALALGVKTTDLMQYSPIAPAHAEYRRLIEFAKQRIESWMADSLCTGTGNTKGREFLAQNTLNWTNKSQVNSTASLEITDKDRVRGMSDEELRQQAQANMDRINQLLPNVKPFKVS